MKLYKGKKIAPSFLDLTNKEKKRKDNKILLSITKKLKVDEKSIVDGDNNNNNNNNNNENDPNLSLLLLKELHTLSLNVLNIRSRRTTIKTISTFSNSKILITTVSIKLKYESEECSY